MKKKMLVLLTLSLCASNAFAKKLSKEARKRAAFTALGGPLATGAVGIYYGLPGQRHKEIPYNPAATIESAKVPVNQMVFIQGYGPSTPETLMEIFRKETNIKTPNINELNLLMGSITGDLTRVKAYAGSENISPAARKLAKKWINNKNDSSAVYFQIKNVLLNNE